VVRLGSGHSSSGSSSSNSSSGGGSSRCHTSTCSNLPAEHPGTHRAPLCCS
jgi:hypothetical protein